MRSLTVVGGGIGGLVAASVAATTGWKVKLLEAQPGLGGLASTTDGEYLANVGPHALYANGRAWQWLQGRGLLPPTVKPALRQFKFAREGKLLRVPMSVLAALRKTETAAPKDQSHREWASTTFGSSVAETLAGLASLVLYDPDPGDLSASSVQSALGAGYDKGAARYVVGGWARMVQAMASHARSVGVEIVLDAPVSELPPPPVILAVDLDAARRLTGDDKLTWPSRPTALLDVGLVAGRRDPAAVLDVSRRIYTSRYSSVDPSLAPSGHSLVQAHVGVREGDSLDDAVARIEAQLDVAFAGWRNRERWRQRGYRRHGVAPADPPGTDWHDRPQIERGDGVFVVNDRMAQPGLLSDVAVSAAIAAVSSLEESPRRRTRERRQGGT